MNYVPTIGLEIHSELKTRTKMFCDSLNNSDEKTPNINICPICMGHPGTLPVPNIEAIKKVVMVGRALGCEISEFSKFDRKNYFYPDLPKGYQISQYDKPFCEGGKLDIGHAKQVRITRIHLEEDVGRLLHPKGADYSLVDFNRAGVPLMELVTEPDIHSAEEARKFAEELQLTLRYLAVSDADMEKGQMRVEVNISLAKEGAKELGIKVEIKNLNSFRAVERAIIYETKRQGELLDNGEGVVQETRGWDEASGKTFSQREKEEAQDYRYFPEPDIPPIKFSIFNFQFSNMPELPRKKRKRFIEEYKIDAKLAEIFIKNRKLADYYEQVVSELIVWEGDMGHKTEDAETRQKLLTLCANYMTTDLRKIMDEQGVETANLKVIAEDFAEFVNLIHIGKISSRGAKNLLPEMVKTGIDPHTLMENMGLAQVGGEEELAAVVDKIISENPKEVEAYKAGKEALLKFFVGQMMKETGGSVNPQIAVEILKKKLSA